MAEHSLQNVIVFDGVCNLCHAAVRFVLKFEATPRYQFAAVQSEVGIDLLRQNGLNPDAVESFLLIREGRPYTRSTAALELCRDLPKWRWLRVFTVVPSPLRDTVYNIVARYRYRWFGRKKLCQLSTDDSSADTQNRFLR